MAVAMKDEVHMPPKAVHVTAAREDAEAGLRNPKSCRAFLCVSTAGQRLSVPVEDLVRLFLQQIVSSSER